MEWDQITAKWSLMALRLRNDGAAGAGMLESGRTNGPPDSMRAQTAATCASNDGLSRTRSAERTGSDRGLTPGR